MDGTTTDTRKLRDVDGALREAARFRAIKGSVEYDRLLGEWENDTLLELEKAPLDAFLLKLIALPSAKR